MKRFLVVGDEGGGGSGGEEVGKQAKEEVGKQRKGRTALPTFAGP